MSVVRRRHAWTSTVLPRVLLVIALVLGLCAMHVVSSAISQHHAAAHQSSGTGVAAAMVTDHTAPAAATSTAARTSTHDHHSAMADCVLFLSVGAALLLVLVAWAAAQALRRSPWLPAPWFATAAVITPRRGPPLLRWPWISLCVVRV